MVKIDLLGRRIKNREMEEYVPYTAFMIGFYNP